MGSIRKDYISDHMMIVAARRAPPSDPKKSPYLPGNESMTKPSVLSLVSKDGMLHRLQDAEGEYVKGWIVRVFESDEPVVTTDPGSEYGDRPHYEEPSYGYHYVVVSSPSPRDTLATISQEQWANVLVAVQERIRWLYTQKGVTYVAIYGDHGEAKKECPHLDIVTFSSIPPVIEAEADASHRIFSERGICPMCDTIETEGGGPREVLQTDDHVAFCPWAASRPYEFRICPKRHATGFSKVTQRDINDLSRMLRATLGGLSAVTGGAPYSIAFHLSPEKKNSKQIHWHIEVYPSSRGMSGIERGYGVFFNDMSPEDAAEKLSVASRKEFASIVGIS